MVQNLPPSINKSENNPTTKFPSVERNTENYKLQKVMTSERKEDSGIMTKLTGFPTLLLPQEIGLRI